MKCKKSDPKESIQPFEKSIVKTFLVTLENGEGMWQEGGMGEQTKHWQKERMKKEQNACWIFPKKRQSFSPSSINYTFQFSGTFLHLVTCQPTDGRPDLVALTLAFPAVFQNFSAEDLHNLIHQLLVLKHVYLRLWGQGDSTKPPSYLCLEDSWRKGRAGSLWGTPIAPNKQTLSHASRNIRNATYVVGNFKSHFKFVYVTEELN